MSISNFWIKFRNTIFLESVPWRGIDYDEHLLCLLCEWKVFPFSFNSSEAFANSSRIPQSPRGSLSTDFVVWLCPLYLWLGICKFRVPMSLALIVFEFNQFVGGPHKWLGVDIRLFRRKRIIVCLLWWRCIWILVPCFYWFRKGIGSLLRENIGFLLSLWFFLPYMMRLFPYVYFYDVLLAFSNMVAFFLLSKKVRKLEGLISHSSWMLLSYLWELAWCCTSGFTFSIEGGVLLEVWLSRTCWRVVTFLLWISCHLLIMNKYTKKNMKPSYRSMTFSPHEIRDTKTFPLISRTHPSHSLSTPLAHDQ